MIHLRTDKEIETMIEGGKRLREVVKNLRPMIKPGVTTQKIDRQADLLIKRVGGEASFKKVPGYHFATCLPVNEQIVHTPPSSRTLKNGDVLTLDIGLYFGGFHTDYSDSFIVGKNGDQERAHFLDVGRQTLVKAIRMAHVGNRLGHISQAIEEGIRSAGYFPSRELTGHGIGRELHEEPYIPGYLDRPIIKTDQIKPGMVFAIEVIYAQGTERIAYEKNTEWSIISADHSLSACFEHTIAIKGDQTITIT